MVAQSVPCVLHEDTFYEYFKPVRHVGATSDIWGGHGLETHGEDLEIVRLQDPAFLWTVVDGDSGTQWIATGFRYVNRVCYLVTERPHNSKLVEFRVSGRMRSLTPLGIKRQVSKLKRFLAD